MFISINSLSCLAPFFAALSAQSFEYNPICEGTQQKVILVRSVSTNLPYLIQHLASNMYQALILQSLNVKKNKLPKLPGFYYPPVYEQVEDTSKISAAIYIKEGID